MKQAHIPILKSFDELRFNIGKKTLAEFLKGDPNPTIERNRLDELNSYGCLYMLNKSDIYSIIDILLRNNYLTFETIGKGFQVLSRTPKGAKEVFAREFEPKNVEIKKIEPKKLFNVSKVDESDKKLFLAFDFFLNKYNDEQKKAIISDSKSLLCVAGAGSGKTTVLTKRVEFLCKFRSVKQEKILAVTFTKKAREEMENRLIKLGIENVKIETFNSFCEKILKRHGDKIYSRAVRVAQYRDKIGIVKKVLRDLGISFDIFFDDYFNKRQIREKTADELFFIFVNDIFSIIDFYKNFEDEIKPFYELENNSSKRRVARNIYDISRKVWTVLKDKGLRDFSDQIVDVLQLFRKFPNLIPNFEHVLVDEFQDVNKVQVDLLKLLKSQNIFAVGDPRQAIYGWRGSEIKYIVDFPKLFEETKVIELKKNYRSSKEIVNFFNLSIKSLGLADLESQENNDSDIEGNKNLGKGIFLVEQDSEVLEKRFVLEAIKNSKNERREIFVLARTNKTLEGYADFFSLNGISYAIKSEEEYKDNEPRDNDVVLATVHSIKGMEAKEVFLVGANSLSFPNKVVDNFVFALVKNDSDYDKEAEERRLFYVALSRAKEKLVISYAGNCSKFVTSDMLKLLHIRPKNKSLFDYGNDKKYEKLDRGNVGIVKSMLKDWRAEKAKQTGLPLYMIISNNAIEDLCKILPQSKAEMYKVNGLGEVKIAKYGDELLKIINGE